MKFFYISMIAIIVISCSETKMLQKNLNNYKAPIGYLHDSKKTNCLSHDSVIIRLNNNSLDSVTSVSKINELILPFIVFNYTELNMGVKLGQSSIQQQYNDFFASSLITESKRTGCFGITNQKSNDSVYTIDITIDSCKTTSKYQKSSTIIFLLFAYSYSFREMGFPAETNLQVSAKLRKNGLIVSEKTYSLKRTQPFLNPRTVDIDKLHSDFTTNLVESLSLCTKQCIEEIISDINNTIKK